MLIVDTNGLPMGTHVEAANQHESIQVQDTLVSVFTDEEPERLIFLRSPLPARGRGV